MWTKQQTATSRTTNRKQFAVCTLHSRRNACIFSCCFNV